MKHLRFFSIAVSAATMLPLCWPLKAEDATSSVPSDEQAVSGSIDLGYRWRTDVAGSFDTYRSLVNLGSGPKLLGVDLTLLDPKHKLFDRIDVRAYNWGGDPYGTLHVEVRKARVYDFTADYRDYAYFNYLPSYADPLSAGGTYLNEQSFDTRRKLGNYRLELLPGNWIVPYFIYERQSSSGLGATAFVSDGNDFAVPSTLSDLTNMYRGGVRIERRRFHVTLEGGGTRFDSAQSDYSSGTNTGNNTVPYLGQPLTLSSLAASYGINGSSQFEKGLLNVNAASWLDFYGQFMFSQPTTNVTYAQSDAGNLLLQTQLLFFTGQQYLLSSAAKLPHTSASLGAEIRPFRHVRIVESWFTDRLHSATSANSTNSILAPAAAAQQTAAALASSLATDYNQQELNVLWDVDKKVTLRLGHRYVWGDASDLTLPTAGLASSDQGSLSRQVGLAGLAVHASAKLTLTSDGEVGSSSGAYFRTSLYDYWKGRGQVRYRVTDSLSLSVDGMSLSNRNNQANTVLGSSAYQADTNRESLSLFWAPSKQRWDLEGTYARSAMTATVGYLYPSLLSPVSSRYVDNANTATGLLNIRLTRGNSQRVPKLTAGGSLFLSSGSRPTSYYQPLGRLFVPIGKHANGFAEWTYQGYGESFYMFEGFRTHIVVAGVRLTR